MGDTIPLDLHELLRAPDSSRRDAAWEALITRYTKLLMATARRFGGDHDAAMDRYAFLLEKLRDSDYRRLRAYRSDRGASFTTWLTVTARRLCLDHERSRHGRHDVESDGRTGRQRDVRQALSRAIWADVNVDEVADPVASIESAAVRRECEAKLLAAVRRLEPRDRLLIALRYTDDLPASRIAALMNFGSVFHVYRRLRTVLAQLRKLLEADGVDGPGP